MGVSPFGHPRIEARLQLPEAYRSLPRPSSAPIAQAFALRPFLLDLLVPALSGRCQEQEFVLNQKLSVIVFYHNFDKSLCAFALLKLVIAKRFHVPRHFAHTRYSSYRVSAAFSIQFSRYKRDSLSLEL